MNNDKLIKNLIRLDGKTALVSGGAGHLGRAISETLAELGSDIVIIGQNGSDGKIFAEELIQKGGIDGFLVGRDSLIPENFNKILQIVDETI